MHKKTQEPRWLFVSSDAPSVCVSLAEQLPPPSPCVFPSPASFSSSSSFSPASSPFSVSFASSSLSPLSSFTLPAASLAVATPDCHSRPRTHASRKFLSPHPLSPLPSPLYTCVLHPSAEETHKREAAACASRPRADETVDACCWRRPRPGQIRWPSACSGHREAPSQGARGAENAADEGARWRGDERGERCGPPPGAQLERCDDPMYREPLKAREQTQKWGETMPSEGRKDMDAALRMGERAERLSGADDLFTPAESRAARVFPFFETPGSLSPSTNLRRKAGSRRRSKSVHETEEKPGREATQRRHAALTGSTGWSAVPAEVYVHLSPRSEAGHGSWTHERGDPGDRTYADLALAARASQFLVDTDRERGHAGEDRNQEGEDGELQVMRQEKERPMWMNSLLCRQQPFPHSPEQQTSLPLLTSQSSSASTSISPAFYRVPSSLRVGQETVPRTSIRGEHPCPSPGTSFSDFQSSHARGGRCVDSRTHGDRRGEASSPHFAYRRSSLQASSPHASCSCSGHAHALPSLHSSFLSSGANQRAVGEQRNCTDTRVPSAPQPCSCVSPFSLSSSVPCFHLCAPAQPSSRSSCVSPSPSVRRSGVGPASAVSSRATRDLEAQAEASAAQTGKRETVGEKETSGVGRVTGPPRAPFSTRVSSTACGSRRAVLCTDRAFCLPMKKDRPNFGRSEIAFRFADAGTIRVEQERDDTRDLSVPGSLRGGQPRVTCAGGIQPREGAEANGNQGETQGERRREGERERRDGPEGERREGQAVKNPGGRQGEDSESLGSRRGWCSARWERETRNAFSLAPSPRENVSAACGGTQEKKGDNASDESAETRQGDNRTTEDVEDEFERGATGEEGKETMAQVARRRAQMTEPARKDGVSRAAEKGVLDGGQKEDMSRGGNGNWRPELFPRANSLGDNTGTDPTDTDNLPQVEREVAVEGETLTGNENEEGMHCGEEPEMSEEEEEGEETEMCYLSRLLGRGGGGKRRWKKLVRQMGRPEASSSASSLLSTDNELSLSLSTSSSSSLDSSPSHASAPVCYLPTGGVSASPSPFSSLPLSGVSWPSCSRASRPSFAGLLPESVSHTLAIRKELRQAALLGSLSLRRAMETRPEKTSQGTDDEKGREEEGEAEVEDDEDEGICCDGRRSKGRKKPQQKERFGERGENRDVVQEQEGVDEEACRERTRGKAAGLPGAPKRQTAENRGGGCVEQRDAHSRACNGSEERETHGWACREEQSVEKRDRAWIDAAVNYWELAERDAALTLLRTRHKRRMN
ncbi:conserved hypothetical protein [Neospora caninum Liverpool]|uniref:Uncharacterized protein n=1 Tax=Neospora caninum (strain Liverpool) TaxID=572307 RepID=F0VHJ2_NEOCL|nr:conserved hypothetical protein [Neospora caninum Liverpool]CBZ53186.1 conserved hypothetical protein [Neospora caninum Liverpool]CEL67175.1 TPA: hypothetical protein BN1204_029740 [Neospora caninum Liverpool]|eukprot:XP_003883218.1 conserved hypothetical protein [Neospora caninum Liverpool]